MRDEPMHGLGDHLSDLEASFFHDTDRFALPPLESWEDLDDDYEPQGFWARAFGSRPRAQAPARFPSWRGRYVLTYESRLAQGARAPRWKAPPGDDTRTAPAPPRAARSRPCSRARERPRWSVCANSSEHGACRAISEHGSAHHNVATHYARDFLPRFDFFFAARLAFAGLGVSSTTESFCVVLGSMCSIRVGTPRLVNT